MKSWVDQTYHQKYQMNPVNKQVNLILRQGLTYTWNQIPFKCHFCELKVKKYWMKQKTIPKNTHGSTSFKYLLYPQSCQNTPEFLEDIS